MSSLRALPQCRYLQVFLILVALIVSGCGSKPSQPATGAPGRITDAPSSTVVAPSVPAAQSKPTDMPIPTVAVTPSPVASATITPIPMVDARGAQDAVCRAHELLAKNEMNSYIDMIDPEARSEPSGIQVLNLFVQGITGLKVDLTNISFRDLSCTTLQSNGEWALVRVAGFVRNLQLATETPIDGIEAAHNIDGKWFISSKSAFERAASEADAQTKAAAEAAAAVERAEKLMAEVDKVIADGDGYIAASMLRSILVVQPSNQLAADKLQSLGEKAPGGILVREQCSDVAYYPFAEMSVDTIPGVPHNMSIGAVAADGSEAYLCGRGHELHILDLTSGSLSEQLTWCDKEMGYGKISGLVSRDGKEMITRKDMYAENLSVSEVPSLATREICSSVREDRYPAVYWLPDGKSVVYSRTGGEGLPLTLADASTNTCREFLIPGWNANSMLALLPPEGQPVWIATEGQLLAYDETNGAITKVMDLPPMNWKAKRVLGSEDGSAIFINGYVLSPKTKRIVKFETQCGGEGDGVEWIAWLDAAPAEPAVREAKLVVTPTKGPRATKFSFSFEGGGGNQPVVWKIFDPAGNQIGYGEARLDGSGALADSSGADGFGLATGIDNVSGTYRVEVDLNGILTTATFDITD